MDYIPKHKMQKWSEEKRLHDFALGKYLDIIQKALLIDGLDFKNKSLTLPKMFKQWKRQVI